jgi:hypothetical protein
MSEFKFSAVLPKSNYDERNKFTKWISFKEIGEYVFELLDEAKVEKKLILTDDLSQRVFPTNFYEVTVKIEYIVSRFFQKNKVFSGTQGSRIYLVYDPTEDFIDVVGNVTVPDEECLAIIDWWVM